VSSNQIAVRRADVAEILSLRHQTLRQRLPPESARFEGDLLETTKHYAAVCTGEIVGCATILLHTWQAESAWQLRGMAVDERVRGRGVGKLLLDAVEKDVGLSDVRLMWCNARVPAVGFYERAGWRVVSEAFEVPTAGPHVKMLKRLNPRSA
jgi:ribosomal protein S18 acetylase RimI-like enzyme